MGIDLSRLRRGNDHDRRPWHGAAFIVEALVLLVFLIASLAVIMQVIAGAHERSIEADRLSNAIKMCIRDSVRASPSEVPPDRLPFSTSLNLLPYLY